MDKFHSKILVMLTGKDEVFCKINNFYTMVTGEEYIFENIYEARDYILSMESKALQSDSHRSTAPFEEFKKDAFIPTDSLDYPLSAYYNNADDCKFIMTKLQSGRYSLKPNLKNRYYLFRGESEFHSPCKPNLFRNPRKKYFLDSMIYGDEMVRVILSHPLVQLLDLGVKLNGSVYRFEMNLYGLLQHYYNKSSLLDLTSDIDVALFFATQKYDWESDKYTPIIDENHEAGILYYYEIDINRDFLQQLNGEQLSTIGLQVFPRSGRQKGFLYNLNMHSNFNDLPQLKAFRFRHNAVIAQEISEQMNCGEKLFPHDILKAHWRSHIRRNDVVSKDAIMINLTRNSNETYESIEARLKQEYNISTEDYIPIFTEEELHEYYNSVDAFWKDFCDQIYIPGDIDGRMITDLVNIPNNPEYEWAFKENTHFKIDYNQGYLSRLYKHILNR